MPATLDDWRGSDGRLIAFAWPGGYPVLYVTDDGGALCPPCANGGNGSEASPDAEPRSGWRIVAGDIHYEGAPAVCDHCGTATASAYGDPDAPATKGGA